MPVPRTKPGDDAPARDHVEHRDLLGHADRVRVQRQRVADHADRDALGLRRRGTTAMMSGDGIVP